MISPQIFSPSPITSLLKCSCLVSLLFSKSLIKPVASFQEQRITSEHKATGQCPLKVPPQFALDSELELELLDSTTHATHSSRRRSSLVTIGHRGSSYNLPEHTLEGYRLALELGADYIEPDLVPTKDLNLVAIHNIDLNITTDVATKFPDRYRLNQTHAGLTYSGYFVQDFTLEEVKTLRVKQRVEDTQARSRYFDYLFQIPTFVEILELLHDWNTNVRHDIGLDDENHKVSGRAGLYVELKTPSWIMEDAGIDVAELFLKELGTFEHSAEMFFGGSSTNVTEKTNYGCEKVNQYQVPPLVVQCFYSSTLKYLKDKFKSRESDGFFPTYFSHLDNTTSINSDDQSSETVVVYQHALPPPMVFLVSLKHCHQDSFWYTLSKLGVSGVGPDKDCILGPKGKDFMLLAHEHDLAVHAWTERLELEFLYPADYTGGDSESTVIGEDGAGGRVFTSAQEELRYLYCVMGIHGIFAENVDVAVRVGALGCDDFKSPEEVIEDEIKIENEEEKNYAGKNGTKSTDDDDAKTSLPLDLAKKLCYETDQVEIRNVGLASFSMGFFIGGLFVFWISTTSFCQKHFAIYGGRNLVVASGENEASGQGGNIPRSINRTGGNPPSVSTLGAISEELEIL